jgi:hypothetical protein
MPSQALEEFSGRVTLRMSKSLHASVSKLAEREGVSLNSWIVESVSARAGAGFSRWAVERASQTATAREFNMIFRKGVRLNPWMVEAMSAHESASSTALTVTHKTFWKNFKSDSVVNQVINLPGTSTQMSTVNPENSIPMQ